MVVFISAQGGQNNAYTIDNTLALHRFYVLDQGCLTNKKSPRLRGQCSLFFGQSGAILRALMRRHGMWRGCGSDLRHQCAAA
jgi:hypothetical protein